MIARSPIVAYSAGIAIARGTSSGGPGSRDWAPMNIPTAIASPRTTTPTHSASRWDLSRPGLALPDAFVILIDSQFESHSRARQAGQQRVRRTCSASQPGGYGPALNVIVSLSSLVIQSGTTIRKVGPGGSNPLAERIQKTVASGLREGLTRTIDTIMLLTLSTYSKDKA